MRAFILPILAMAVSATPALAQEAAAKAEDKVICKREREKETGSNLPAPRVCRKASEWRELNEQTERLTQDLNDKAASTFLPPPSAGGNLGPE